MNTQQKKLLAIAAVVLFHGTVITVMLAQHGCKSDGTKPDSTAEMPAPAPVALPAPTPVVADTGFTAPTRPQPESSMPPPAPTPLVQMGEPLLVPAPTPVVTATPSPTTESTSGLAVSYVVSKGENLASIARMNKITKEQLVAANSPKINLNTTLQPGMTLIIPNAKVAATAAAPAPVVTDSGNTYKVVSGDSLGKIATKNHTTVKALKELNGLTSDNIGAGKILKLPAANTATPTLAASATPATAAGEGTYTVKSGDSIDKIARTLHISSADLLTLNNLTAQTAGTIRPGRVLKLPTGTHVPTTPAVTSSTSAAPPPVTSHVTLLNSGPPPVTAPVTAFPASNTSAPPLTPVQ